MGFTQISQDPLIYIDHATGLEAPLRKYVDVATGKAIIFLIDNLVENDKEPPRYVLRPVYMPDGVAKRDEWKLTFKLDTKMQAACLERELKTDAELKDIHDNTLKESTVEMPVKTSVKLVELNG